MRIALGIEYNGDRYFGWQRQRKFPSVQQELEASLSRIANRPVDVFCAGRTDSRVNCTGQVVHFDTNVDRGLTAWSVGVNSCLPKDVAVRWAVNVSDDFHARFSAIARQYRYVIYNHELRPSTLSARVGHYHGELDEVKMHEAGQYLLGEHDFSSFRSSRCQSSSPWRHMSSLCVSRWNHYVFVDIKANAFVQYMVRNIVGSLITVGRGNQPADWIRWLLKRKSRTLASATAKPEGLYLVGVDYPSKFNIPPNVDSQLLFS